MSEPKRWRICPSSSVAADWPFILSAWTFSLVICSVRAFDSSSTALGEALAVLRITVR
ncbi:hypothetical protein D3C71_2209570 [compost metagenome]